MFVYCFLFLRQYIFIIKHLEGLDKPKGGIKSDLEPYH